MVLALSYRLALGVATSIFFFALTGFCGGKIPILPVEIRQDRNLAATFISYAAVDFSGLNAFNTSTRPMSCAAGR